MAMIKIVIAPDSKNDEPATREPMTDNGEQRIVDPPANDQRFAETRLFEPDDSFSRQEEDIAFAAALLQSGLVNERELAAAVFDWSMYGSVSLAQHLQVKGS